MDYRMLYGVGDTSFCFFISKGEIVQTACLGFGAVLQLDFLQPRM
jgi:hypothetical protein